MDFFIKKNATLPVLKMLVIKNGRSDFQTLMNNLQQSDVTFSMSEIKTGIPKIVDAPCEISQITLPNGDVENYVYFKFTSNDTKTEGKYKGSFSIGNNQGTLVLPLTEEIYINIQDSFISTENCCSDQPSSNSPVPAPSTPLIYPTPTPTRTGELQVGQKFGGGTIALIKVYPYTNQTLILIVNTDAIANSMVNEGVWGKVGFVTNADIIGIGGATFNTLANYTYGTEQMIQGLATYYIVNDSTNGYTDWKLPSLDEMIEIYKANNYIKRYGLRWTSTEIDADYAYCFNMYDGTYEPRLKSEFHYFLGIRYEIIL